MRGYKVFDKDWTCRGFQYKVGEVYEIDKEPKCCKVGFHFCEKLIDCFKYYAFNPENKVAIVESLGNIDKERKDSKICTNKIKIIEELTWYRVLDLLNTGYSNTGYSNTGNFNTGNWNAGHRNTGNCNTGYYNVGYCNTGDWNTENCNTGHYNIGYYNTGDWNIGNCNTGYNNTGNFNTGDYNTGCYNTGDWNTGSYSIGCFNTKEQKVYMFNKKTNITYEDWRKTRARHILKRIPSDNLTWVDKYEMTEKERKNNPTYKTTGGYLEAVKVTNKDRQEWYDDLSEEDKKEIQNIPNFDASIFKEITGIEV